MKTQVIAVTAALALVSIGEAWSQQYPTKPIRMIVPFTAGSQTDLFARIIVPKMAENWGQQVVVDNRPGAGGIVAGSIVVDAAPDGYTLMLTSSAYAVSAAIYSKLPYDPLKDMDGVAKFASVALVLVVAPDLGVKSVKERMQLQGAVIKTTTPEEFAGLLRTDIATLKKVAQAANVRID